VTSPMPSSSSKSTTAASSPESPCGRRSARTETQS
jgi:hypothetical protein